MQRPYVPFPDVAILRMNLSPRRGERSTSGARRVRGIHTKSRCPPHPSSLLRARGTCPAAWSRVRTTVPTTPSFSQPVMKACSRCRRRAEILPNHMSIDEGHHGLARTCASGSPCVRVAVGLTGAEADGRLDRLSDRKLYLCFNLSSRPLLSLSLNRLSPVGEVSSLRTELGGSVESRVR